MVFRYEWDLIESRMWNWWFTECPCSRFGVLGSFFPASCPKEAYFFKKIGTHSMQGWTATASYGIAKKEAQKD